MLSKDNEIQRRRTFAIISHPDAGKNIQAIQLLICEKNQPYAIISQGVQNGFTD
ncbi:MAG: hypothetical protein LBD62_04300 [Candidatus Margulisbacteria bacterium]|jgi:peptide subunit release factor RF-3|nr:hypothetical protein [Candidatus Margulisiibacteriota bacterium]